MITQETHDQQMRDSDMIFTQISTGSFKDYAEAELAIVILYIPDMTISRAGCSYVMKRLERHYAALQTSSAAMPGAAIAAHDASKEAKP